MHAHVAHLDFKGFWGSRFSKNPSALFCNCVTPASQEEEKEDESELGFEGVSHPPGLPPPAQMPWGWGAPSASGQPAVGRSGSPPNAGSFLGSATSLASTVVSKVGVLPSVQLVALLGHKQV